MPKIYMLLGILLGILLASSLTSCNTVERTIIVQGGGGGPCGPNCAPSRARMIEREVVVVREQPVVRESPLWPSFIQVNLVPGGGCPPRGRMMMHQPVYQGCEQPWYRRQWVPVDQGCPQPMYNGGGNQPYYGGGGGPSTWGNPNGGPGGYR